MKPHHLLKAVHQYVTQYWTQDCRQSDLAAQMGMSHSYFSLILHGKRPPPRWFNRKLAQLLSRRFK